MSHTVDLTLFRRGAHNPSYFSLLRSGKGGADIVDFCVPCNPYFPTAKMFAELAGNLETILKYYPTDSEAMVRELGRYLDLDPKTMALANGSTELITWIDHLLIKESIATPIPTFGRWTDQPTETGKRLHVFNLLEEEGFRLDPAKFVAFTRETRSRVAVLCNPNNPDGGYLKRADVVRILDELSDLDLVVIDESFIDFVEAEPFPSVAQEAAKRKNVVVLKSLGKNFGLHGVRFGYSVSHPETAERIRSTLPKWNINSVAEAIIFSLRDNVEEYRASLRKIFDDRREMAIALKALPGLTVYPSQGNFLFVKLPEGRDGVSCRNDLLTRHGVFIRECGNKRGSTSQFLRLVVRPRPEVARLTAALGDFLRRDVEKAGPTFSTSFLR